MKVVALIGLLLAAREGAAAIRGSVIDSIGKPVAHAQVVAYAVEKDLERMERVVTGRPRTALAKATTVDDGTFSLDVSGNGVVIVGVNGTFRRTVIGDRDVIVELPARTTSEWRVRPASAAARVIELDPSGERETKSDAAGTFTIDSRTTTLLVVAKGFAPQYVVPRDHGTDRVVLLDAGTTLRGEVVGPDHKPVAGARIAIDGIPLATSAADGTYVIEHAPSHPNMVEADAGSLGGRTAAASSKLVLHPRVTISGVVRDAEKHPLRGIAIDAGSDKPDAWERGTVSDETGALVLRVTPGKYELVAGGEHMVSETIDVTKDLVHDLVAKRAPMLGGIVKLQDGTPVAGAHVGVVFDAPASGEEMTIAEPSMMTPMWPQAITSRSGAFALLVPMPAGRVRVEATKPGLPPAESEPLNLGAKHDDLVLVVPKAIDIVARVTDSSGRPVEGASVYAKRTRRLSINAQPLTTSADGRVSIPLAEGTWNFAFEKTGYASRSLDNVRIDAHTVSVDVKLDTAAVLRGRVLNANGTGAGDITLSLNETAGFAQTAADGTFSFANVAAGPYKLRYFSLSGIDGEQAVNAPADDIRIVLPENADVHGRVIDATGAPVSDYSIVVAKRDGFAAPRTISDADGRFEWKAAPFGPSRISVSASGFAPAMKDIDVPGDEVTIVLTRGRTLRGKVTGRSGEALAGVSVDRSVSDSWLPTPPEAIVTADDGSYEIKGLPSAAGTVSFRKDGFASTRRTIAAGDGDLRLDVQLTAGRTIVGHVLTADGKPVAQANVSAQTAAAGGDNGGGATTAEDGSFSIGGLVPAHYDFVADGNGIRGRVADVDVAKVSEITIRLAAPTHAAISGRIIGAGDARMISVTAQSGDDTVSVQADSTGSFRFENAPIGTVTINAVAFTATPRYTKQVTIDVSAESESHVDLTFPEQFTITGRVTTNGTPVAGAALTFGREAESARAATRDDGTYTAALSAGHYWIGIEAASVPGGYYVERDVTGPGTIDIAIDLTRVTVSVFDASGSGPLAGAVVSTRSADERTHSEARGTTGANGQVSIAVPRGVTQLVIEKSGYATAVAEIKDVHVDVPMTRTDGAVVRLIDARDGRTLTGTAIARDDAGHVLASANEADSDGTIRLPLLPGTYRFSASASEYGSQTVRAQIPASEVTIALPRAGKLLLRSRTDLNATARLIEPDGEEYVRCWCSGVATIAIAGRATLVDQIAPGSYALEVTPASGKARRIPVTVIEGVTTPVSVDP